MPWNSGEVRLAGQRPPSGRGRGPASRSVWRTSRMMRLWSGCLALLLLLAAGGRVQADPILTDLPPSVYITVGNLDWAWASPVASVDWFGSNTLLPPDTHPGWRYATDEELANRPPASAFLIDPTHPDPDYGGPLANVRNAVPYWNTFFTHLDYFDAATYNAVRSTPDGSYFETWYVREASTTPEPASLTLLGIGGAGLLAYGWRRKVGRRI